MRGPLSSTFLILTAACLFATSCRNHEGSKAGPAADAAEWRRHNKGTTDVLKNWRPPDSSQQSGTNRQKRAAQKQQEKPNK
jgi:hypothetical protein